MKRFVILVLAGLLMVTATSWAAPKEMNLKIGDPGAETEWAVGASNTVKWSFRGELGQAVNIRLQRSGWVNAQAVLSESTPIGANRSGSFKWTTPPDLPPGGNYTISVTAENGIGDTSDEFKLIAGKIPATRITLDAIPKGSERWAVGTTVSIRWTYGGNPGQSVKLALIKKEVGVVAQISAAAPLGVDGKGRIEWTVPGVKPANDYYVGIVSNANSFYQDMSKDPVVITATK